MRILAIALRCCGAADEFAVVPTATSGDHARDRGHPRQSRALRAVMCAPSVPSRCQCGVSRAPTRHGSGCGVHTGGRALRPVGSISATPPETDRRRTASGGARPPGRSSGSGTSCGGRGGSPCPPTTPRRGRRGPRAHRAWRRGRRSRSTRGPRLTICRRTPGPTRAISPRAEVVRLALDDQRQRALPDQVDLLLALVIVDPPTLARGEDHEVHAHAGQLERPAQRDEALVAVECERVRVKPVSVMAPMLVLGAGTERGSVPVTMCFGPSFVASSVRAQPRAAPTRRTP